MEKQMQEFCWTLKVGHEFTQKLQAFVMPRVKQALEFIPLSFR